MPRTIDWSDRPLAPYGYFWFVSEPHVMELRSDHSIHTTVGSVKYNPYADALSIDDGTRNCAQGLGWFTDVRAAAEALIAAITPAHFWDIPFAIPEGYYLACAPDMACLKLIGVGHTTQDRIEVKYVGMTFSREHIWEYEVFCGGERLGGCTESKYKSQRSAARALIDAVEKRDREAADDRDFDIAKLPTHRPGFYWNRITTGVSLDSAVTFKSVGEIRRFSGSSDWFTATIPGHACWTVSAEDVAKCATLLLDKVGAAPLTPTELLDQEREAHKATREELAEVRRNARALEAESARIHAENLKWRRLNPDPIFFSNPAGE